MSQKTLKVSSNLSLPFEMVTQTIGILAKRGVGKTYTASVIAEEFVDAKLPFCVLDPTGAWWGLRVLADGKPGLPVIIIGGKHGDIPLEPTAGKLIADLIVDNPGFYVLDMSLFDSNANQDRFATDFAERLYRKKQVIRDPLHLFVDEADSFAPQRPYRGQERMLGAFEALTRRGRIYGIGVTLISQRAAVINKNVLSQIEILMTLQTTAPQDRDAIEAWAEGHGTPDQIKEMMGSLASLGLGEAWIWSPSWLELFKRIQIRKRITFNSSATPKIGEVRREPKALAAVDIEKLKKEMAATIERVKADDPAALRREIAELKKHKCPEINQNPIKIERIKVPIVGKRALDGMGKLEAGLRKLIKPIKDYVVAMDAGIEKLAGEIRKAEKINLGGEPRLLKGKFVITQPSKISPRDTVLTAIAEKKSKELSEKIDQENGFPLTNPEQRILDAIAWLESIGIGEPEQTAVAFLAGYSFGGGAFNNPRGALRTKGLVEYVNGGAITLTDAGRRMAKIPEIPLTTEELHKKVFSILPGPESKLLKVLIEVYPSSISNQELAERAGYAPGGGAYNNPRGRLRSLGLIDYKGLEVVARPILFLN